MLHGDYNYYYWRKRPVEIERFLSYLHLLQLFFLSFTPFGLLSSLEVFIKAT
jgi:hypothetical protein